MLIYAVTHFAHYVLMLLCFLELLVYQITFVEYQNMTVNLPSENVDNNDRLWGNIADQPSKIVS